MSADRPLPSDHLNRTATLDITKSFLVQAPAGSGKTELLTRRLLKLLAEVDEPEEILAITFTIAATAEMRNRVLQALHQAEDPESPGSELLSLAKAALANNRQRGWNLLQQPQRLNILTIDAVCLAVAHQTPLLSRLGGSLSPTDKPQSLYALAARRTLARLGDEPELSGALRALLQLRSASLSDCEKLIAAMLDKRDQWGRVLPLGRDYQWNEVRDHLEEPLRRLHQQAIHKTQSLFSGNAELELELIHLIGHACGNLDSGAGLWLLSNAKGCRDFTTLEHWACLSEFLLTKKQTWRKKTPSGFDSGKQAKPARDRYVQLIAELEKKPGLLKALGELRELPPQRYTEEEWQMLQHLLVILRYAMAELRIVFSEQHVVDFVELGLAAREVLTTEEGRASELAGQVAGRWRHLLVDEFQDTSRSQYELLTLFVEAWESEGHGTCFLVGDPMQSIYMFRQAEVELFERTRRHGLGEGTSALPLTALQLQENFRSHSGLVDPLNHLFEQVFAPDPDQNSSEYCVSFAPSKSSRQAPDARPAVTVWPFFRTGRPSTEEKQANAEAEAAQVVSIIQKHWPKVEELRPTPESYKIAVLVRARSHLSLIAQKLRDAYLPFRAIEIEQLNERQEVQDLAALTRALLHPMDRVAWLTILRAPWCGLTLKDLHMLCGSDNKAYAAQPVIALLRERTHLLGEDGQLRARRLRAVLEDAVRGRHRQFSLARWVERTWNTLGGDACVDRTGYANVRAFFTMLETLGPDAADFEPRLKDLCAQPDPSADEKCGVQLMTIHKAKGLGFQVVIVPGLERSTQIDSQPLLHWIEQTRLVGQEEKAESEFLVAPIGRNGEAGGIYQWIAKQHGRRQHDEAKRLLYVAATRASEELHLLGAATVKVTKEGEQELSYGAKHSLLGIAWQALREDFEPAFAAVRAQPPASPQQAEFEFAPPRTTICLSRLPAGWKSSHPASEPFSTEEIVPPEIERPGGSLAARAFGTVVHALLEDLATGRTGDWRARSIALLRANGVPRSEAEKLSSEVVRALQVVDNDPAGRWILGSRADGTTESAWSTWAEDELIRSVRCDRIFRAGAFPCSTEDTHLWIVDYKTARHGESGLQAFLDAEKQKYQQQLEAYAAIMRKVHGEETPIRLALYYPLLPHLIWW